MADSSQVITFWHFLLADDKGLQSAQLFNRFLTWNSLYYAIQGSASSVQVLHLVWTIREASLFDIFARKVLKPLISNVPGVFVHLFITGTRKFPALSPLEVMYNLDAIEALKGQSFTLNETADPHRSALDPGDAGPESLIAKRARAPLESSGSTHNFLLSTLEKEDSTVTTKENDGVTKGLASNFAVSFGRPNYGNMLSFFRICLPKLSTKTPQILSTISLHQYVTDNLFSSTVFGPNGMNVPLNGQPEVRRISSHLSARNHFFSTLITGFAFYSYWHCIIFNLLLL